MSLRDKVGFGDGVGIGVTGQFDGSLRHTVRIRIRLRLGVGVVVSIRVE